MSTTLKDLFIDQGASFIETIDVADTGGIALDLNNFYVRGTIKKSYTATTVAATFDVIISTKTQIKLYLNASSTASLSPGRYVYDVIVDDGADSVDRIMEGIIVVSPGVTYVSGN